MLGIYLDIQNGQFAAEVNTQVQRTYTRVRLTVVLEAATFLLCKIEQVSVT